jgi:signal transduction histidine kinase
MPATLRNSSLDSPTRRGIEFRVRHLDRPPHHANSDYDLLWRILSNLVVNAIKFTLHPPSLDIQRSLSVRHALATGSGSDYDTGIGVKGPSRGDLGPFFR